MDFVSRAGEKLDYALKYFKIDVRNKIVADFGSSTGGFVDCLLFHGASKVYSVDTAKNMIHFKLKENECVKIIIANAMYISLNEAVDIVTIDVGWTKQKLVIPNALNNLKINGDIISLIKPQYEAEKRWLTKGVVEKKFLNNVLDKIKNELNFSNIEIKGIVESPIKGSKGKNIEYLMWIKKIK
jgi:23S rRNA (cytidine1920-2'-O)/16S rRNA (cytidine1409-2'-O)-methyltransferase